MSGDWHKLAEAFPLGEIQWRVEALSEDKHQALVVPFVEVEAVLKRLDETVGIEGWQDQYEVLSIAQTVAVKCRLSILEVSKEDVGEGPTLKTAFADALKRAACKFGVGRYLLLEQHWVDHDPESGEFASPDESSQKPAEAGSAPESQVSEPLEPAKPEPQELIDRLIERLKENGLGKQAAMIVSKHGGYGKTSDDTRRLYSELRALLKGQS